MKNAVKNHDILIDENHDAAASYLSIIREVAHSELSSRLTSTVSQANICPINSIVAAKMC